MAKDAMGLSEQNYQTGYGAANAANQLLSTAMQLKYPPLEQTSTSSTDLSSQGTTDSSGLVLVTRVAAAPLHSNQAGSVAILVLAAVLVSTMYLVRRSMLLAAVCRMTMQHKVDLSHKNSVHLQVQRPTTLMRD